MYESIHYFTILLVFSKDFVSRVSCFLRQTKLLGNIICCFRYPGKFLTTIKEQRFWRSDRSKNGNQCGIFVKLVVHLLPCGLRDPVTSNLLSCKFTSYVRIQHHGVIYENYEQKKIDAFKQYTNLFEVLIQWVQSVQRSCAQLLELIESRVKHVAKLISCRLRVNKKCLHISTIPLCSTRNSTNMEDEGVRDFEQCWIYFSSGNMLPYSKKINQPTGEWSRL